MNHRRAVVAVVAAIGATGLLGACTSQPSAKAVAKDVVQSITVPGGSTLPQAQQDCMLAVIDDMSSDQIEQLSEQNIGATITPESGGDEEMRAFIERLQGCGPDGSTTGADDSTAGSAPESEPTTATTAG